MLSTPFFCFLQINGLVVLEFKMIKNLLCHWHFKVSAPLHYFLDRSYQPPMYSIWKAHQWHDYFFLDCKKQYKIPAWAMTSTVLVSNRSFCLGVFRAGRSNVGPKTIAKLCRDILFSLSLWCILKLWKKCFFFQRESFLCFQRDLNRNGLTSTSDPEWSISKPYLLLEYHWILSAGHWSVRFRWCCWTYWKSQWTFGTGCLWIGFQVVRAGTIWIFPLPNGCPLLWAIVQPHSYL